MPRTWIRLAIALALALAGCATGADVPVDDTEGTPAGLSVTTSTLPTDAETASVSVGPAATNGISYHGGSIMTGTTHVYYIWYGSWSSTPKTILQALASGIGGSPYFNINTTYHNASGTKVANSVTFAGATSDSYSQGKSLGDSAVKAIVSSAITSGRLPRDTHGVYFVLTASDVTETSGFCSKYCGWHSHASISSATIKYAFIGDPARCPTACESGDRSVNGNAAVDGMASIIAHELEEAVTDPLGTAWYDSSGAENADKCAWQFGATRTASNGGIYNQTLGARHFLIQENWLDASGGRCAQAY